MEMNRLCVLLLGMFLFSVVSAAPLPSFPHQFYGNIEVNGIPSDGDVLLASVDGRNYSSISRDGTMGYSPNPFLVEDPDSDSDGELVTFYVGGMEAGSYVFQNGGYTELNFNLTTVCGDNFCLGGEDCLGCSDDCGECTDLPPVVIVSPESRVYNTTEIDLDVVSRQEMILWMYSLNGAKEVIFNPNTTITAQNGTNTLSVIGVVNWAQNVRADVVFSVDLIPAYCGDGVCDLDENCTVCAADCRACPVDDDGGNGGGGSGGGGSGGGSSGGGSDITVLSSASEEEEVERKSDFNESEYFEEAEREALEKEAAGEGFFSVMTGAVVGVAGGKVGIGVGVFVVLVGIGFVVVWFRKR